MIDLGIMLHSAILPLSRVRRGIFRKIPDFMGKKSFSRLMLLENVLILCVYFLSTISSVELKALNKHPSQGCLFSALNTGTPFTRVFPSDTHFTAESIEAM